ncbi:hypothetical protein K4F52_006692 [Lecanicillium sp. MT-2017a]|nr:hypothetical protein K4F52_006692 [Lecanicillium sp. MT-2017a]
MDIKSEKVDAAGSAAPLPSVKRPTQQKNVSRSSRYKRPTLRSYERESTLSKQVHRLELQTEQQRAARTTHAKTILHLQAELQSTTARADASKKKLQADLAKKSKSLSTILGDYYRLLRKNKSLETDLADTAAQLERTNGSNKQRDRALETSRRGTEMVMEELYWLRMENEALQKSAKEEQQKQNAEMEQLQLQSQLVSEELVQAQAKIDEIQTEVNMLRDTSRIQRCTLAVVTKLLPPGFEREAFTGLLERVARHYAQFPNGVSADDAVRFAQSQAYPTPSPSSAGSVEKPGDKAITIKMEEDDEPPRKRQRVTDLGSPVPWNIGRKRTMQ